MKLCFGDDLKHLQCFEIPDLIDPYWEFRYRWPWPWDGPKGPRPNDSEPNPVPWDDYHEWVKDLAVLQGIDRLLGKLNSDDLRDLDPTRDRCTHATTRPNLG